MTENKTVRQRPSLKINALRGAQFITNLVTQTFRDNSSKLEIFDVVFAPESTIAQQLEACEGVLYHIARDVNVTTFRVATKRYPAAVEKLINGRPAVFAYHAYRTTYYNKQVENVIYITAHIATADEWEELKAKPVEYEQAPSPLAVSQPSLEELVYAAQHSGINMVPPADNEVQEDTHAERSDLNDTNSADVSTAFGDAEA